MLKVWRVLGARSLLVAFAVAAAASPSWGQEDHNAAGTGPPCAGLGGPPSPMDAGLALCTREADGAALVRIDEAWGPSGPFVMGLAAGNLEAARTACEATGSRRCGTDAFLLEAPPVWVALEPFYIDRTEVSRGQYDSCVLAGACPPIDESSCDVYDGERWVTGGALPEASRALDVPRTCATRDEATTYCQWAGGRLPSEAEWERAARGGGRFRSFPWGETYDGACVTDDGDDLHVLTPVDAPACGASVEGVLNLAGNAYEWVADGACDYSAWPFGAVQCPNDVGRGVLRGGSFLSDPGRVRTTSRRFADPAARIDTNGFRCAHSTTALSDAERLLLAQLELPVTTPRGTVRQGGPGEDLECQLDLSHGAGAAAPTTLFALDPSAGQAVAPPTTPSGATFLLRPDGVAAGPMVLALSDHPTVWGLSPVTGVLSVWEVLQPSGPTSNVALAPVPPEDLPDGVAFQGSLDLAMVPGSETLVIDEDTQHVILRANDGRTLFSIPHPLRYQFGQEAVVESIEALEGGAVMFRLRWDYESMRNNGDYEPSCSRRFLWAGVDQAPLLQSEDMHAWYHENLGTTICHDESPACADAVARYTRDPTAFEASEANGQEGGDSSFYPLPNGGTLARADRTAARRVVWVDIDDGCPVHVTEPLLETLSWRIELEEDSGVVLARSEHRTPIVVEAGPCSASDP